MVHRHLTQPLAAMVAGGKVPPGAFVSVDLDEEGESLRLSVEERGAPPRQDIRTVLVVDDNSAIVRWIARLLRQRGYDVLPAGGVEEARAKIEERPPDVAILDHVLPDGEGVVLAEELRRRDPGIRIVMMSGFELNEEDRLFCVRNDLPKLTKPFLAEELLHILDSLSTRTSRARAHGS